MPVRLIKEVGMIELLVHGYCTVTLLGHGVVVLLLGRGAFWRPLVAVEQEESLAHAVPLTDSVMQDGVAPTHADRARLPAAFSIALTVSVYGVESQRLIESCRAPVAAAFVTRM
jgi:hypothetical protein